jgi:hypothetical protein
VRKPWWLRRAGATCAILPLLLATVGCSLGQGTGDVKSNALFARDCWGSVSATDPLKAIGAPYDMQPNFFAADPDENTLQIRVQSGSDLSEVSDGLLVSIDDIATIRAAIVAAQSAAGDGGAGDGGGADAGDAGAGSTPGATFQVALPLGIHPPGSPTVPPPQDLTAIVHMALYLERSCHNQNTTLLGVGGTITFRALFDGDPSETSGANKLTDASFSVQFGDVRDTPLGEYAGDIPIGLQSNVYGSFTFYFERGQPGQPFP